ncbi:unnamed protein product [Cyprideis torosa]|uniref:RNA helicase n=1 Tax=Cyprideis torosa TaxID=163714 RepID=A0A7R8WJV1_9CRUS|nr:unnamed protein product [Cyprideis torosa]CAG0899618.1 unnamed protein product [Cyprideis torosa]
METNPEQLQAVQAILNHTSLPYPFILFGPPGTGKTFTLVEAVTQLVLLDTEDVHVLICGPSNSSCDVIAKRLIERIPKEMVRGSVHRLYASSRQRREVDDELIPFSNMDDDGQVSFESRESLMDYQVIICTLITAGRLAQAVFPEGHFTHLIIDEVSQATEPDAVVALNAVRKRKGYREPHVILAGDPRQLGPVVFSPLAETNLGTSLLERLMARPPYVRDVDQPEHYNPSYIVKLKKNFRSHPALLETPNKLFYDSELEACADRREVDAFIGHPILKNPKIPLVFHGVQGRDQKEGRSPSYFNPEEATLLVTKYVDQILQSKSPKVKPHEIGIITPYRGQVYKISKLLEKHGISGITVGTPEEFQGQERKVIMMSTVRSTQEFLQVDRRFNLGFLRNPKRFNVAITRARALMIVVGCPQILATDPNWHALVSFAYTRGCYEGCELPPEVLEATAPNAPSEPRGLDELLKILREMNLNPTVAENLASERPLMASREE